MNDKAKLILNELRERYGKASLSKRELANELGVSDSTIDLYMSRGYGVPDYKKLGTSHNSKVIFNIIDVAEFLADTTKTA
jgi:transcriptional regulator with XRE-family HTH domain